MQLRPSFTAPTGGIKAMVRDLIERGLSTERALVFVIDGSKALRAAIAATFGTLACIHRCQVHTVRNVLEHLPDTMKPSVARARHDVYNATDPALALRQLERLARSLEREHPGAAAALREGLAETLTLRKLGIAGWRYRCLRSTNLIEGLNGQVATFTRNVRRWRGGAMIVRWVATAVRAAERRFRRLKGHKDMPRLVAVLEAHERSLRLDTRKKVA